MKRWNAIRRILLALLAGVLVSCERQPAETAPPTDRHRTAVQPDSKITGTVTYRERILLQPGSRLQVTLQDVSRADAPAKDIADITQADPGQVPISFEIPYHSKDILADADYSLQARIVSGDGRLLFINDTHTPVITNGAGTHADIVLVGVRDPAAPEAADAGRADETSAPIDGLFGFEDGRPRFKDCRTSEWFPVAQVGPYAELEKAYRNSGIKNGDFLHVRITGRMLERQDPDQEGPQVIVIVDSFEEVLETADCVPSEIAELEGTVWELIEVDGNEVAPPAEGSPPHLVLDSVESRINGIGGCNSFSGQYRYEGERLEFPEVVSTLLACADGMETESRFFKALERTNRFRLDGLFLELYADERKLARLEAVHE